MSNKPSYAQVADEPSGNLPVAQIPTHTTSRKAQQDVIEGRPGIIESTHIDPLSENSNKDDGWANATAKPSAGSGSGYVASAANLATGAASTVVNTATSIVGGAATVATGAAQLVYGTATGNEATKKAGKEGVFGSSK